VGAVADIVVALADAKINVVAIDAVCADSRYGALCWVAPGDVKKAAQVLNAQQSPLAHKDGGQRELAVVPPGRKVGFS
jgi:hypothetical protein